MKALLSLRTGAPETLVVADIAEPVPAAGEVRIAVAACGINFPDFLIVQDLYQYRPERPFSPGAEVSGVIDALGEGVEGFKIGDRVAAMVGWGGLAEKCVISADRCYGIPDSMPFDIASSLLMTYGTSQYALQDCAKIKPGETLFILGAAGGVGLAAVELGKAYGARVVAGVSSEAKAQVAREHGADETLIYPVGDFDRDRAKALTDQIKRLCGGDGADVIYDSIGGAYAEPSLRAIAWQGRYLVVGFPGGIPKLPTNLVLLKGCSVVGVFWGGFIDRYPKRQAENVAGLYDLYARGLIKPYISEQFPLERGGEAIRRLGDRTAIGKLVVTLK